MTKGKLASLPPMVMAMPSRLGYQPGDVAARDRQRVEQQPWRRWYRTARWKKVRWSVLARDLFRCKMCHHIEDPAKLVCDHIKPHRGDELMFWDGSNLQTLCAKCHSSRKQAAEQPRMTFMR